MPQINGYLFGEKTQESAISLALPEGMGQGSLVTAWIQILPLHLQ